MKIATPHKRPKYLRMSFYCSYTGQQLSGLHTPYDPIAMLKGKYRGWYNNFKSNTPLLNIYRQEGMLVGKVKLHIDWYY